MKTGSDEFVEIGLLFLVLLSSEAVVHRSSSKEMFLKIWQNSLENTCARVLLAKHSYLFFLKLTLLWKVEQNPSSSFDGHKKGFYVSHTCIMLTTNSSKNIKQVWSSLITSKIVPRQCIFVDFRSFF